MVFSPIRFFSTDMDGTILGDDQSTYLFKQTWEQLQPPHRPILCYNTGRLLDDVLGIMERGRVPIPDYIISGVGTTIYDTQARTTLKAFNEILEEGWNQQQVEAIMEQLALPLEKQPAHYQHPFKSSWYFNDASPDNITFIQESLDEAGLEAEIVYSSGRHLDILPKWANKGNALRWLLRHLHIPTTAALVAGDSGNDNAMFALKGVRGIVVGNAQLELRQQINGDQHYVAPPQQLCAQAVLHGLRHFGVIGEDNLPLPELAGPSLLYETLRTAGEEQISPLTFAEINFIREGYHQAINALKKNITPLGFTACSPDDNEVIGTDENYQSIWARDGSLTLIGSLPLLTQDEAIHQCQRQTLETLLKHISPNGQIPANVRVKEERPDYSGVGGIAAIDGGIWVIIAFYEYIAQTRNLAFLRHYFPQLQAAMNWLSAHDSNNDALLEIPEAGDWTDLFGRSYNILYDEVLWYRCNIVFGRLLQMLGDEPRAGHYLRWARIIKQEILANFWPTTESQTREPISFSEQQYSLGDARYLIAQVTPFSFSWRCDSFGNVLAFLYDVTDAHLAGQTFRFLWGVGINEPYPMANLYPVVTAGDPEWRPYYTVNLLNLPYHYHNGGIWPFVGGHWVRFIHKLGLQDLALRELYRLAELNKLGVLHEWEFNEWAHGRTGRPMGKAYQAWSASEYIRACHALHIVA